MNKNKIYVTEDFKKQFTSNYLLYLISIDNVIFSTDLQGSDTYLEPIFVHMYAKDYVIINKKNQYAITEKGKKIVSTFSQQYTEYLNHFDIYSAVDLELGEFAFAKIFELDEKTWDSYLQEDRFADLRITVALFKGINPACFVFLNFLQEGRFNTDVSNWQFDLLSGLLWQEIEDIIESAITVEELAYTDEDGSLISGEMVVRDILAQGAHLNTSLQAQETSFEKKEQYKNDFATQEEDNQIVTTYISYCDPFYVNPIWLLF